MADFKANQFANLIQKWVEWASKWNSCELPDLRPQKFTQRQHKSDITSFVIVIIMTIMTIMMAVMMAVMMNGMIMIMKMKKMMAALLVAGWKLLLRRGSRK